MKKEYVEIIKEALLYAEKQQQFYTTWGKVEILQIAMRTSENQYIYTKEGVNFAQLNESSFISSNDSSTIFGQLFLAKKKLHFILITQQEFASQVQEEIPPILDDQAQLLGISVRIAHQDNEIKQALKSRFAAILPNRKSICLGATFEDAYIAAQLLEKTSKAFVEAKILGGVKSIHKIEAWLMQQFYQLKYAKQTHQNK